MLSLLAFFFFKQKTAYEMRISDWSSDVCSSDLIVDGHQLAAGHRELVIRKGMAAGQREAGKVHVAHAALQHECPAWERIERDELRSARQAVQHRQFLDRKSTRLNSSH